MRLGKTVLTKCPFLSPACLLSSKHLALACTSVPVQGRLFSNVCLPSALSCPWSWILPFRLFEHYAAYGEAYQAKPSRILSHQSQSKVWIMCLCCPLKCVISSGFNRVTKCLEWHFTTFIDLDLKPLVCFEECINQSEWHQQAFHLVQRKRAPLKSARELL